MGKQKTKRPVHDRRDIPYSQRMQMQRVQEIQQHRDDAATTALKIALVALNDTEKLGFTRLCRFAMRIRELNNAYQKDPELEGTHLNSRLEKIGFQIGENGGVLAYEDPETGTLRKIRDVIAEREAENHDG